MYNFSKYNKCKKKEKSNTFNVVIKLYEDLQFTEKVCKVKNERIKAGNLIGWLYI
jgi:hypothetical protein